MKLRAVLIAAFVLLLGSSPSAAPPYLYVLSKPLKTEAKLDPLSQKLHYGVEMSLQIAKAGLVYHATGSAKVAVSFFGEETAKYPIMVRLQSEADLRMRAWYQKQKALRALVNFPAVQRVAVVDTSELDLDGLHVVASKMRSKGVVVFETERPLTPEMLKVFEWPESLGEPILVENPQATQVNVRMVTDEAGSIASWRIPLDEIFETHRIPEDIASDWRETYKSIADPKEQSALRKARTLIRDHLFGAKTHGLKIEASIIKRDGTEKPIGTIAEGERALSLIRARGFARARRLATGKESVLPLTKSDLQDPGWKECLAKILLFVFDRQE